MTQSETYSSSPLPRERVDTAFPGDDGRDAALLQPAKQAPQFSTEDTCIAESSKERLDGIEHDATRTSGTEGVIETNEEAFEIVFASLLDLRALDSNVFQREALALDQIGEIVAE